MLCILLLKLFQLLASGNSCRLPPMSFNMFPSFFSPASLFSHPPDVIQMHLIFSLPQPWVQPIFQRALVPFIEKQYLETKIWVLFVIMVTAVPLFSFSQWI